MRNLLCRRGSTNATLVKLPFWDIRIRICFGFRIRIWISWWLRLRRASHPRSISLANPAPVQVHAREPLTNRAQVPNLDDVTMAPDGQRAVIHGKAQRGDGRSEEHTSELQSLRHLVC